MKIVETREGAFADRILSALSCCTKAELMSMWENDDLRMKTEKILNCKSLRSERLELYGEVTGCSVKDFFYGTNNEEIQTYYTQYDKFVISMLNVLTEMEIKVLMKYVPLFYPNDLFFCDMNRPNHRLSYILFRKPRGFFQEEKIEAQIALKKLSPDILCDVELIKKHKFNPNFQYDSNLWIDWATLAGVSLHWVFNLKKAFYCSSPERDIIFDRYTLMQPAQQKDFVDFLIDFNQAKTRQLAKIFGLRPDEKDDCNE